MYRMSSTGCLVVSPTKVVTAIAFHSEMTVGSPTGDGEDVVAAAAVVAAVAVPAATMIRSTAAPEADHLRVDRNFAAITANRLMAITPPAIPTVARRGVLSSSGRTRRGGHSRPNPPYHLLTAMSISLYLAGRRDGEVQEAPANAPSGKRICKPDTLRRSETMETEQ